ncbi:MAG: potassium/proton antiporter [Lentisphaerae bacterium]|jgi:cell volume regulation protein A|nr:potassium/proton antiporter [Lentisphaerota bacterium]
MNTLYTIYLVAPLALISIVLAAIWLDRWSVPVILIAMGGGILVGRDLLNWWHFDNVIWANHLANFALVFILFQGGFGIDRKVFRRVALAAGGLATWGVILTAALTLLFLWKILGWDFQKACLLAVIISSTDAAATLSILRRYALPRRLSSSLIIESAANDPMAVLLTVVAVQAFTQGAVASHVPLILRFLWMFIMGPVVGWAMARVALYLFNILRPQERSHYYVLFFGVVLITYGLAEVIRASGMLAVFIAGYIMGNRYFVHKHGIANFFSSFSSIANICMFLLLGLLVSPKGLSQIWADGLILFLVLTFFSRPLAVLLGTVGMKIKPRYLLFMIWAGLRGSVPIVLATYPAAAGMPGSDVIFNLVFFAVILSVLIQGSTLGPVARRLKLLSPRGVPDPLYSLELFTMAPSDMDLVEVDLPETTATRRPRIQELKLPPETVITLISRGAHLITPNGPTLLHSGDRVTVLTHHQNEKNVRDAILAFFPEKEPPGLSAPPDPPPDTPAT